MSLIRARTSQRLWFLIAVLIFAALSLGVFRTETKKEWIAYQEKFQKLYEQKIRSGLEASRASGDRAASEQWEKKLREVRSTPSHLRRIYLPDSGVRDLCTTCHLGIDNPLFADASEPFKTHPGTVLQQHPPEKFGCTLCHKGQGVGTSTHAAHGLEETWLNPLLPKKYLQATCAGCHDNSYSLAGAEQFEKGRQTFAKYGCYGCHGARSFEEVSKFGPTFEGLKNKLSGDRWMLSWLRAPEKMRPGTIMPTFKLTEDEMRDITSFVLSIESQNEYPKVDLSDANAQDGEELFTNLGCRACHSAKRDESSLTRRIPNLAEAGVKLNPDWIFEYLKDPRVYNPETKMPRLDITESDRRNLTAYLVTLKDNADIVNSETLSAEGGNTENGAKLVQLQGCYGCHRVKSLDKAPTPGVEVAEVAAKALDELPFGNSSVENTKWDWIYNKIKSPRIYETTDMPLKMPEYVFDEGELEALTVFYLDNAQLNLPEHYLSPATPSQIRVRTGERIVTDSNCRGCHMFEEPTKPRIDEYIGLKTYVPPRLVSEGEKVQPQWAFQYLSNPFPMRPWLKIRMPNFSFTYEEAEDVIEYFSATAGTPQNAQTPYVLVPRKENIPQIELDMGEYRVLTDKCMQCHPISLDEELPADVKLEDLSINLMLAKVRLRPEWIRGFLRNPDKYAGTGTKMPYVFYTPDGAARVSDPEMWINYITNYLMVMEEVPKPLPEEEKKPEEEVDWTDF